MVYIYIHIISVYIYTHHICIYITYNIYIYIYDIYIIYVYIMYIILPQDEHDPVGRPFSSATLIHQVIHGGAERPRLCPGVRDSDH